MEVLGKNWMDGLSWKATLMYVKSVKGFRLLILLHMRIAPTRVTAQALVGPLV